MKMSDYHEAQSKACHEHAMGHKIGTRLHKEYKKLSRYHHSLALDFVFLEVTEDEISSLEAEHREKCEQDERDYWTKLQLPKGNHA